MINKTARDRELISKLLDDLEESDDQTQTVIDFVKEIRRHDAPDPEQRDRPGPDAPYLRIGK